MPTIAFKSRIRTVSDNCTLDLVVSHRLVAGEPSAAPRVVKNLPPKGLDIVLVSPLTIRTTGMLNNRKISAEGLMTSRIAQHLLEYLKLNSSELGFEVISDTHIAKDTGLLTFFCTASRPSWPLKVQLPHLKLLGFDIHYSWHETPSLSSPDSSGFLDSVLTPFSSRLTLPYATALDNAVERFVKFQMVNRYPRIFGSWIQQLDQEKPYISSIFISLSNILRRSSNPAFQESCQTQLKMLEKAMFASQVDSENRLSGYLESPGTLNADKCQHASPDDDETVFIHAMEQIYWLAMKGRKIKSISTSQNWLHAADDIFCDQQSLLVGFAEEPHPGADDHEEDLNSCLGQYEGILDDRGDMISASLAEDLFASDSDHLDTQRAPGLSSDISRDAEQRDSFPNFSPILGSLPADRDSDYMSLIVAQSLENDAAKVYTPGFVPSDLGYAFIHPTSSCAGGYHLLSESQVEHSSSAASHPSHYFSLSQDISGRKFVTSSKCNRGHSTASLQGLQIMEDLPTPAQSANAETVSEWVSSFHSSVDFVAMEF